MKKPRTFVVLIVPGPAVDVSARVATLLGRFRRAPGMYAITREAFLSLLSGVLLVACPGLKMGAFYARHLGTRGSCCVGPLRRLDDDWARAACDDAFRILMESL